MNRVDILVSCIRSTDNPDEQETYIRNFFSSTLTHLQHKKYQTYSEECVVNDIISYFNTRNTHDTPTSTCKSN